MKLFHNLLLLVAIPVLMAGCSLNEGLSLSSKYANTANNWQLVKQPELINKLPVADQAKGKEYAVDIDSVMTFLHKFINSDDKAKAELAVTLPVQVVKARNSFKSLNILVLQNKDRFSESDLAVMADLKDQLSSLYNSWNDIIGDSEKVSQLLDAINTVVLLQNLSK